MAISIVAGSGAGIISTLIMYPLEFLRTRLQQQAATASLGPVQILRTVLYEGGGIKGLYTGLPLPLMAQIVYKANVFTGTMAAQNFILDCQRSRGNPTPRLQQHDIFWSGVVAGSYNALIFVTPVEFVRNQLIQQPHLTTRSVLQQVFQLRGVPGLVLWRGTSLSVLRDGIGCGCFFTTHAIASAGSSSLTTNMLAGALAGISFWLVALPIDTIKTWVQSADMTQPPPSVGARLRKIYYQEGPPGVLRQLFRGWQVAYGRGAPSAAITIASYTFIYQRLGGVSLHH